MHRIPLALADIIRSDRHLPIRPGNNCVVLKENGADATLTELNIDCRGCDHVIAFTLDKRSPGGHPIALSEHTSKAASSKWNKVCDGIFVWRDTSSACWRVLVCDLKSSTPHGSDWKEQLWSSACFVEYLFSIVRRYYSDAPRVAPVLFHAVTFHGDRRLFGSRKRTTAALRGAGYPRTTLEQPGKMSIANNAYVPLRALCR